MVNGNGPMGMRLSRPLRLTRITQRSSTRVMVFSSPLRPTSVLPSSGLIDSAQILAKSRMRSARLAFREPRPDQIGRVLHVCHFEVGPPTQTAPVVHRRDPQILRRGGLGLLLFLLLARDFDEQGKQVVVAPRVLVAHA